MTITELFSDQEWDAPFFKRLPLNDTGASNGNQSGMELPKELRQFLPHLGIVPK